MQQYLPWIVTALALLALVLLLAWQNVATRRRRPTGPPPLPVAWDLQARPVFSADERRLYRQLQEALPHHLVLAKLPLVRFCQPIDSNEVRYWYDLLGAIQVNFAVCSVNGRVLAAIDLNYERSGPTSRATRIKQAVLGACRIRYLRCAPDHLPSVPELQLLVPQTSAASRGPQPAPPASPGMARPGLGHGAASLTPRRRERAALWRETMNFKESFFAPGSAFEPSLPGDLLPPGLDGAAGHGNGRAAMDPGHGAPPPPLRH